MAICLIGWISPIADADPQKSPNLNRRPDHSSQTQPIVTTTDPDIDLSEFENEGWRTAPETQELSGRLPMPEVRDRIYGKAGFTNADLDGLDAFDRDRMYLRARHFDMQRLIGLYPNLAPEKLMRLHHLLQPKPKKSP